jgi:hypothetical protein
MIRTAILAASLLALTLAVTIWMEMTTFETLITLSVVLAIMVFGSYGIEEWYWWRWRRKRRLNGD